MDVHIAPVRLEKAYRLLNHGPTVLVAARHAGVDNVMAAAWSCALAFAPPELTIVLDKATKTRELVERAGTFVVQVPTVAQRELTYQVGQPTGASPQRRLNEVKRDAKHLFVNRSLWSHRFDHTRLASACPGRELHHHRRGVATAIEAQQATACRRLAELIQRFR